MEKVVKKDGKYDSRKLQGKTTEIKEPTLFVESVMLSLEKARKDFEELCRREYLRLKSDLKLL